MAIIVDVKGREILGSRGNPTVEVEVSLEIGLNVQSSRLQKPCAGAGKAQ